MEWTPADCFACVSQAILPGRSVVVRAVKVVVRAVKCDETVIISGARLALAACCRNNYLGR